MAIILRKFNNRMFGIFKKKKKPISEMRISEAIVECKIQGVENLSINLFIEDQILFQVIMAKHFTDRGLDIINREDMAVVHFFHKNKNLTIDTWEKFKQENMENDFLLYEEPKGVFIYVKNIGDNPREIEEAIKKEMLRYNLINDSKISIEYTG